jgi:hypothetical protein
MASKGFVASLLNTLPAEIKRVLVPAFDHVLDNLRLGLRDATGRAENFQGYRFDLTTSSVAGTEVSVEHGLGQPPYMLIPILPLDSSGGQVVRLTCSRPADDRRFYVKSSDTGAPISVYVEV